MNTRKNRPAANGRREKELWIGVVEVRPRNGPNKILCDRRGAFVNIVTWASDAADYKRKAELVIGDLGDLFVSEVVNPEPVDVRRGRTGGFREDIEDMISRAERNPDAIIYGTFHTFENEDA